MIVYLGGSTGDINNQSWWKNLPSYGGAVDDKQIDAIIAALDGRHREILLVGYSQGGLDAQNIAASGRLGDQVKAVVTFGSPITTPPSEHYKTVHLADINDFVPKVSLFDPAKWKTLTLNVIGGTPFIGLSTTGFQDYAGVHGSQKTYAQIGIQFDRWSGRQDAKQIINRFQGPIMNVPDF
jgi:pimeloyl-ACP methyl ester carboxylesterase